MIQQFKRSPLSRREWWTMGRTPSRGWVVIPLGRVIPDCVRAIFNSETGEIKGVANHPGEDRSGFVPAREYPGWYFHGGIYKWVSVLSIDRTQLVYTTDEPLTIRPNLSTLYYPTLRWRITEIRGFHYPLIWWKLGESFVNWCGQKWNSTCIQGESPLPWQTFYNPTIPVFAYGKPDVLISRDHTTAIAMEPIRTESSSTYVPWYGITASSII